MMKLWDQSLFLIWLIKYGNCIGRDHVPHLADLCLQVVYARVVFLNCVVCLIILLNQGLLLRCHPLQLIRQ